MKLIILILHNKVKILKKKLLMIHNNTNQYSLKENKS